MVALFLIPGCLFCFILFLVFFHNSFSRGEASLPPVCCRLRGGDHGESLEMGCFFLSSTCT